MATVERIELALELSADDPDGDHPAWVRQALAMSTRQGWDAIRDEPVARPKAPAVVGQMSFFDGWDTAVGALACMASS